VIGRKAGLLSSYTTFLFYSLGAQLVIDAIYTWAFFSQSRETLIQRCIDGSTDQEVQKICDNSFDVGKWTFLISMVIGVSLQFCGFCFLS
jgi:hypothetical protein